MIYWMDIVHQGVRRKDHIMSYHHVLLSYIYCQISLTLFIKVISFSKNRRYHGFIPLTQLICNTPTSSYSKGWIQLVHCIVCGSSHFCIILRYKKRPTAIMRGVVLWTTDPMPEDANTTLASIANELLFPVRGQSTYSSTYCGKCQEFIIFWFISSKPNAEINTDEHAPRD